MILVDSNVIIDYWQTGNCNSENIFRNESVCICELVRTEMLRCARSEEEYHHIINALERFPVLKMESQDWDLLGHDLFILRKNGLSVPFQDAIIAHVARKYSVPVWTHDKHFKLIKSVFEDLMLYIEQ